MPNQFTKGMFVGLAAYAFYAFSDALIKSTGGLASVFEIAFFITLFSAIPIILGKPKEEKWRDALVVKNKAKVHVRAISGLCGGLCAIYAFTHLELAEAYALIFLIPAFTTVISTFVLGEDVRWKRWAAVTLGFIGVMIVLRPGFEEVKLAHLGGLGCAFFGAISITTMRSISGQRKTHHHIKRRFHLCADIQRIGDADYVRAPRPGIVVASISWRYFQRPWTSIHDPCHFNDTSQQHRTNTIQSDDLGDCLGRNILLRSA